MKKEGENGLEHIRKVGMKNTFGSRWKERKNENAKRKPFDITTKLDKDMKMLNYNTKNRHRSR